ncbi:MAG: hypothetical protein ABWY49_02175 [Rhizobium sp.]
MPASVPNQGDTPLPIGLNAADCRRHLFDETGLSLERNVALTDSI